MMYGLTVRYGLHLIRDIIDDYDPLLHGLELFNHRVWKRSHNLDVTLVERKLNTGHYIVAFFLEQI
jgi:hypothetical protein